MQHKQLINPSFLMIVLEMQDLLKDGWEIDQNAMPVNNLMYFEVNLVKKEADKKPGRPVKDAK